MSAKELLRSIEILQGDASQAVSDFARELQEFEPEPEGERPTWEEMRKLRRKEWVGFWLELMQSVWEEHERYEKKKN